MTEPYHTESSEDTASASALDYSRDVAKRLSVTARKLRLATSSRSKLFKAVGLRPRLLDRAFLTVAVAITTLLLIAPITMGIVYYVFLASDQYQSEARFTVRSSTPALGRDQIARVTGIPTAKIVQDTQIVMSYISSSEMLTALSEKIDLMEVYSNREIDIWARLAPNASAEEKLKYWKKMTSVSVAASSGIVTVKTRAFTAEDSRRVLKLVLEASEKIVNDVNARIWTDVIKTSGTNLQNAANQLQAARERLQIARNKTGVLTVEGSSTVLTTLIANAQQEMLDLQQRYQSQADRISKNAPQMRVLQREIDSKLSQIQHLKTQLAGQNSDEHNLANVSLDMSQLELEQGLAERQFTASVKTLEQIRFVSKQQLIYLDAFLAPTLPEDAEYPQRIFWIGSIIACSVSGWAIALGLLSVVRNRLN